MLHEGTALVEQIRSGIGPLDIRPDGMPEAHLHDSVIGVGALLAQVRNVARHPCTVIRSPKPLGLTTSIMATLLNGLPRRCAEGNTSRFGSTSRSTSCTSTGLRSERSSGGWAADANEVGARRAFGR